MKSRYYHNQNVKCSFNVDTSPTREALMRKLRIREVKPQPQCPKVMQLMTAGPNLEQTRTRHAGAEAGGAAGVGGKAIG